MTGWCANQYWWRYTYTLDKEWLRATGYPAIRDCALFYTDFLKKGDDGFYHAFPIQPGRGRLLRQSEGLHRPRADHAAHALLPALRDLRGRGSRSRCRSARGRGVTASIIAPVTTGGPRLALTGLERECHDRNPPEFGYGRPMRAPDPNAKSHGPATATGTTRGTSDNTPGPWLQRLHAGDFNPEVDYPQFRGLVERWRRPGGLLMAMSVANYGHAGAWTESFGAIAALQEMMLQRLGRRAARLPGLAERRWMRGSPRSARKARSS